MRELKITKNLEVIDTKDINWYLTTIYFVLEVGYLIGLVIGFGYCMNYAKESFNNPLLCLIALVILADILLEKLVPNLDNLKLKIFRRRQRCNYGTIRNQSI